MNANEAHHASEKFNAAETISHHLSDTAIFPLNFGGEKVFEGDPKFEANGHHAIFEDHATNRKYHFIGGLDMHITKRVTMMWIVCFFLLITLIPAARSISKNPLRVESRLGNMIESIISYLRNEVIEPNMHNHGHGFYGFLFTVFFFVLFCNLFGLIPSVGEIVSEVSMLVGFNDHGMAANIWSGITVTGDISVTVSLAGMTLILIYAAGFLYQGPLFPIYSVPNGVPAPLYLLMFPLEFIVSPLAKCFALTIRLLANMTAGHVMILAIIGFIFEFQSLAISPISVLAASAIYLLEIFVAFLQAFIFTLLASLFIGSSMHRH
ncbi:MAG: F0F1 ATP synthase subunit A [Leptospiraceae bacterium]|nr:F0F1 ATP synthase subunit A [Leptospiraceae bacterium]